MRVKRVAKTVKVALEFRLRYYIKDDRYCIFLKSREYGAENLDELTSEGLQFCH